ncbi:Coenzyme F420-reducing hydrogenase, beta subunit [Ferrimonas sediminum]|uniref:Coenzyme F420-reducing hydrogenase, beta subunit n=1 Tax=Ferrimonas sediminum TaxID=718193 RepID=A0A1G8YZB6_9GAMM|nr:Coenzyme F420 hydrogenase/dehydrogenase, beta subunit C-terminal domain [Ferrimonas sediminum]SDK08229.1 Coenzyme F420-reducing hydrogenase, beta subunit [Ferrimonas sediminum]
MTAKYINFKSAVNKGICSGCGVCAYSKSSKIKMEENKYGQITPKIVGVLSDDDYTLLNKICPFSENSLDKKIDLSESENLVGRYIDSYAGYVKEKTYRDTGSSGGIGSWLLSELITRKIVDSVVHVKKSRKNDSLFEFSISNSTNEVIEGASSKYYPVTMDEVLKIISCSDKLFAIIAVPCFVRAVRNLIEVDEVIRKRIKVVGSLYCGHLKTSGYSKYIADSIMFDHGELLDIDFRLKADSEKSSNYKTEVTTSKGKFTEFRQKIKGTNWGLGMFKYKSCDFCEDVSGELADFSIGDAWLPKYEADDKGTNLLIVRSKVILDIINSSQERLYLDTISESDLYTAQAGGYRHKREGIHVRNEVMSLISGHQVKCRFEKVNPSRSRKVIYTYRMFMRRFSDLHYYFRASKFTFRLFELCVSLLSKIHGALIKIAR